MSPLYRRQGTIEKADKDGYKVGGLIERIDDSTIEITELPVRTWTQSYKEQLESWVVGTEKSPALVKVRSSTRRGGGPKSRGGKGGRMEG
jgi:DNA topoisomerase II